MNREQRNRLAGSAAAFGIIAGWVLEAVATVIKTPNPWMGAALVLAFGAAGALRWFLFYEGQQLNEVDPKKAKIVFYCAVGLSVFVVFYFLALWVSGHIDWRAFTTFVLLTSTLSVAEYAFAVRIAANVHPDVLRIRATLDEVTRDRDAALAEVKRISGDLLSLRSEIEKLQKSVTTLQSDNNRLRDTGVSALESLAFAERFAGAVVEKKKTHFIFVCDHRIDGDRICNTPMIISNAQRNAVCPGCNHTHSFAKAMPSLNGHSHD